VTVDGESAPIYRADYLFRAVPVPEGEHDVAFVYRPLSFYLGSAITAAAGLVLGVLLRLRRRI
jgi:uncharacterized membrane protein YfhO